MHSWRPLGLSILLLASCGPAPGDSRDAPAAPPPKPSFDQTVPGVQATIAGLGAPWAKPSHNEILPDKSNGGTIITTTGDRGEARLYRLPDGWIREVTLTSGAGTTCGDPADVARAIPLLLTGLATKVTLSPDQVARLTPGLADAPPVSIETGAVRVTSQGGCIQKLSVTAITPATPPARR